jgi:hypothetical protein
MRVSLVELLRQAVMGWIPALQYMLSGAHGLLWPCPIVLGGYRLLRPWADDAYPFPKAPGHA